MIYKVYVLPNQGCMSMYEFKNNVKVRTLKYLQGTSHE